MKDEHVRRTRAHTTLTRFEFRRCSTEDDGISQEASRITATTLSRVSRFANVDDIMRQRKEIDETRDALQTLNSFSSSPIMRTLVTFLSRLRYGKQSPFLLFDAMDAHLFTLISGNKNLT